MRNALHFGSETRFLRYPISSCVRYFAIFGRTLPNLEKMPRHASSQRRRRRFFNNDSRSRTRRHNDVDIPDMDPKGPPMSPEDQENNTNEEALNFIEENMQTLQDAEHNELQPPNNGELNFEDEPVNNYFEDSVILPRVQTNIAAKLRRRMRRQPKRPLPTAKGIPSYSFEPLDDSQSAYLNDMAALTADPEYHNAIEQTRQGGRIFRDNVTESDLNVNADERNYRNPLLNNNKDPFTNDLVERRVRFEDGENAVLDNAILEYELEQSKYPTSRAPNNNTRHSKNSTKHLKPSEEGLGSQLNPNPPKMRNNGLLLTSNDSLHAPVHAHEERENLAAQIFELQHKLACLENNSRNKPIPENISRPRDILKETMMEVTTPLGRKRVSSSLLPAYLSSDTDESGSEKRHRGRDHSDFETKTDSEGEIPKRRSRNRKAIYTLEKFNPFGNLRIQEWLERYAHLAQVSEWDEEYMIKMFPSYLNEQAYSWWRSEGSNLHSWKKVIQSLLKTFSSELQAEHWRREYLNARQLPDEGVREFAYRLKQMETKSGLNLTSKQQSQQLIQGLRREISSQAQWARDREYYNALEAVCSIELGMKENEERELRLAVENRLRNQSINNNNNTPRHFVKPSTPSIKPGEFNAKISTVPLKKENVESVPYRNGKFCNYCKRNNHDEVDCRKKAADQGRVAIKATSSYSSPASVRDTPKKPGISPKPV